MEDTTALARLDLFLRMSVATVTITFSNDQHVGKGCHVVKITHKGREFPAGLGRGRYDNVSRLSVAITSAIDVAVRTMNQDPTPQPTTPQPSTAPPRE